jgi:prepilin-type N-terminal cleavage/methylation domain-containing protein
MRSGFSLVELSIVLVILGLLTGGILAGQSLIRASELRAVTSEFQRYVAATNTFRDKYFALPGDITNASSIWSTLAAGNNGNGDGNIDAAAAVSVTGEMFQFWNEMALAGLVEGSYTGLAGPGSGWVGRDTIPGTNSPKSRVNNTGWGVVYMPNYVGNARIYTYDYGNAITFGTRWGGAGNLAVQSALKPEEAWNVDTKLDDGQPASGKIIAQDFIGFTNAGSCTTSTSQTDYAGAYNLSSSTVACSLFFPKPF